MNFELKNLFTCLTQNPGLEKIEVIIKNEALNVLFSKIIDDTVGTEARHTFYKKCFITSCPCFSSTREQLFTTFAVRAGNGQILLCIN